ncbi:MAG: hypothetical protein COU08_00575 [Candidatus Harrisonbacteria bacterium CG10_big_fil_rev_8_21_14_0_10_42_17]|uniref:Uncharacterized protein n=1 Tax=Candidatus Harrisonbacteria bacterium CG10_big_fil_rev_8_21_14_0_10_42_17 TaxID=1974584 RepID=A0A2M6WJ54_9BACT|nr:MAG: hypothetical protein COU08_00575 [Candidatus Harrisonbacteria bacterium CG10_big_fil_rev_8_21_14_0_10_42_17]
MEHHNDHEQRLAEALEYALRLHRKGKPIEETFERFPEYRNELADLLGTADRLQQTRERLAPRKELMASILSGTEQSVTGASENRSLSQDARRAPEHTVLINSHMRSTLSFFLPIGVVAVLLLVFGISYFGEFGGNPLATNQLAPEANQLKQAENGLPTEETASQSVRFSADTASSGEALNLDSLASDEAEALQTTSSFESFFEGEEGLSDLESLLDEL